MGKKEIKFNDKHYAKQIATFKNGVIEEKIIDMDDVNEIISELRMQYMRKHRREPKVLVVPEEVLIVLNSFYATSYIPDYKDIGAREYMGMLMIPTPEIKYCEHIKIY